MKKKYMMAACACMSCILLGSGTYVYARPETSVTNHFSTGVVDIDLNEYELTANGGEEPFKNYTGKKGENPLILPGDDISKIPRITNDGNDCYVRAKLEFSGTDEDLESELYGFPDGWEKHEDGYYYYKNILKTGENVDIFEGLKIPTDFPQTEEGKTFTLRINVDAIQSKNFSPDWNDRSPWGKVEIQDCIREGYDIATFKQAENQSMRVEYQGSSKKLFSNPDDFFRNFPVMMPGDTYNESAGLVNNSKTPIKLYFRSEVTDKSPLLDEINIKIYSTIDGNRKMIYKGPLVNSQITDNILLGTIPANATGTLEYKLDVPKELDNQYTILASYVKWIFSTEPIVAGKSGNERVQTGDSSMIGVYLVAGGLFFAAGAYAIWNDEERKKERG